MTPVVSVIIPVYNCGRVAEQSAVTMSRFLSANFESFELVIVDDGSDPDHRPGQLPAGTRLIQLPTNQGKGAAVSAGMLAAKGKCRIFTDADLPYDLSSLVTIVSIVTNQGIHMAAGDRTHPLSEVRNPFPRHRRILSAVFRNLLNVAAIGSILDTQCGLKGFSAALAERVFPLMKTTRFSFDAELFFLLHKARITFAAVPVRLLRHGRSSVSILRDGLRSVFDVWKIVSNWRQGNYDISRVIELTVIPTWDQASAALNPDQDAPALKTAS